MTYGYEDICEKPFRKISERTVISQNKQNIHPAQPEQTLSTKIKTTNI